MTKKRTSHFLTIWLNKNYNKKRTRNSVLSYEKLRGSSSKYYPGFVVLYLEIVKNIDQMHKSTFSYY